MTTTTAPAPTHERPSLEQQPGKPDIVRRLQIQHDLAESRGFPLADCFTADLADAIATIEGLRAANLRHCEDERALNAARVRVAELEAAAAWRDIANAPQDGSWVLLYSPDATEPKRFIAAWAVFKQPEIDDCGNQYDGEWVDESGVFIPDPTHWRPLDAPPAPLPDAPQTGEAGRD